MECWKWVWLVKQWQACRSLRPCRCCTRCPVCPALMWFQIYRGKPQLGDLWHKETGGRVTLFWTYMSDPLHWCPILQGKQELGFGTSVQENFTNTKVWPVWPHLRSGSDQLVLLHWNCLDDLYHWQHHHPATQIIQISLYRFIVNPPENSCHSQHQHLANLHALSCHFLAPLKIPSLPHGHLWLQLQWITTRCKKQHSLISIYSKKAYHCLSINCNQTKT